MPMLATISTVGTYFLMAIGLLAAVAVVSLRSLFHAALALALVLVVTAGIFVSLEAEFLAMVQILIYVGAVMTLIIFAIMLTERLSDKSVKQNNNQSLPAIAGVIAFLYLLTQIIFGTPWPFVVPSADRGVDTMTLGKVLLGPYVFPFEVISVILIAALIGAITVARKDAA